MGLESLWEEGCELMLGGRGTWRPRKLLNTEAGPDQAPLREGLKVKAGRNLGDYPVQPPHFTDGESEGMCLALSLRWTTADLCLEIRAWTHLQCFCHLLQRCQPLPPHSPSFHVQMLFTSTTLSARWEGPRQPCLYQVTSDPDHICLVQGWADSNSPIRWDVGSEIIFPWGPGKVDSCYLVSAGVGTMTG